MKDHTPTEFGEILKEIKKSLSEQYTIDIHNAVMRQVGELVDALYREGRSEEEIRNILSAIVEKEIEMFMEDQIPRESKVNEEYEPMDSRVGEPHMIGGRTDAPIEVAMSIPDMRNALEMLALNGTDEEIMSVWQLLPPEGFERFSFM
jgi:hypothetical protein